MSSKGKEEKQKESSSDDNSDPPFKSKLHKMLLEFEEKPEIVIEKILINLFNNYINPRNVDIDHLEIQLQQKQIKSLCKHQDSSKIVYILLIKIRSLIKKYKEKLFELPNIIELREKIFHKIYKRSHSQNKIASKDYLNFFIERTNLNYSYPKLKKKFNYFLVVKNLICELKNIKNCLRKTAPIIEKIFEVPLSKFEHFSIWECEKEDYLKILIHDEFIWNQLRKNSGIYLSDIISEITEEENMNLTSMTEKLNYFQLLEENKKRNIDDMLKLSEVGSSIDTRFPEDAKICSLKEEFFENIITEDKDMRYSCEDADIDEYTNSEEQNTEEINNFKEITIYKALNKRIIKTKSCSIAKSILTGKAINNLNININNIPNLLKNNDITTHEDFEQISSLNKNIEIKNINNLNKRKKKELKKKNLEKKENNKNKKTNKIDKNEIPNDLDDLVKYIVNDDKTETQNKKKKRNKKRKKKNKNEIKEDKKDENEEDIKEKEQKDEIDKIKEDLLQNSINRFKIHKIKFKFRPKWLNKISKNS